MFLDPTIAANLDEKFGLSCEIIGETLDVPKELMIKLKAFINAICSILAHRK